ncbi:adenosylmethionine decarboxylase [soil metagenome]
MKLTSTPEVTNLKQHNFAGRHLLASYFDCDETAISDAQRCLTALRNAASASGVTVVSENIHHFPNGAVTAVLLLAESHASIHTYPEHRSCFIDFFTCGAGNIEKFDAVLKSELKPTHTDVRIVDRGVDRTE